ncbi:hypothetical protein DL96DRAFT_1717433 [Flagelloscypha sp. PMI_526]|nr:hypothetical protein DL96DRAFT_1717433 [Flagelloscypha sp. PMI_526]
MASAVHLLCRTCNSRQSTPFIRTYQWSTYSLLVVATLCVTDLDDLHDHFLFTMLISAFLMDCSSDFELEPATPRTPLSPMAFACTSPTTATFDRPISPTSSTSSHESCSSLPATPRGSIDALPLELASAKPSPDDMAFYANELSSRIQIYTPMASQYITDAPRPESLFLPSWSSSQKKLHRRAVVIPAYPPPPPPVSRPLPRSSLPMDLGEDDFEVVWIQDENTDSQVGGLDVILEDESLDSPTFTADDVLELIDEYDDEDAEMAWSPDHVEEEHAAEPSQFSHRPASSHDPSASLCTSHVIDLASPVLKSKFSTSTLGSIPPSPSPKSKWKGGKLRLSSLKVSSFKSPTSAASSSWMTKSPKTPPRTPKTPRTPYSFAQYPKVRRGRSSSSSSSSSYYTNSDCTSCSGDSKTSSLSAGLQRKPIPVEMFLKH